VDNVFAKLRSELGWINRGMHHAPRIHDLRHNSEARIIPSTAPMVFGTWCRSSMCARGGA